MKVICSIVQNTPYIQLRGLKRVHSIAHPTVDPKDLFQSKSKDLLKFWEKQGPFKGGNAWNYLRIPYIRDGLVTVQPGERFSTCLKGIKILDAGCGAGLISEGLARFGAEVVGIDVNKDLIDLARDHCSKNRALVNNPPSYIHTTIEDHSRSNEEQYDAVVVSEVLEHVAQCELFVEGCARAAKPGAKLFFTTPNRTRLAQLYMIFGFEKVLKTFPKGSHDFSKFLRPNELQYMLEINDCHVTSVQGYVYYPLVNRWEWTQYKWFSFAMEAVKAY